MIFIGLNNTSKVGKIHQYISTNGIQKTIVFSPGRFAFSIDCAETVEYAEIIMYRTYYRLIQEIEPDTLVVINECLRTQNRYDLTYNCIRNFMNQTKHQLVFQQLPIIDRLDDFMILFDLDTRSKWKREKFNYRFLSEVSVSCEINPVCFKKTEIETDDKTKLDYHRKKEKLFSEIGLSDPHTIPRNLYLTAGKAKVRQVVADKIYIGRNNRFGLDNMATFKDSIFQNKEHTVFEFPHNFINFSDFITLSGQSSADVLVSDLKVCGWYFDRYRDWAKRVNDACSVIRGE